MMVAAVSMTAHATDYTDQLKVLVNGEGTKQQATISVNEHDGLYDLNLKNFVLMNGDSPMPVGNVELKNISPEMAGNAIFLRANQNIMVTDGDLSDVPFWMGPMLGELPVQVTAVIENDRLRALIDLDLSDMLGQIINVSFGEALVTGTGYHIPNGDFEAWHTSSGKYVEPNAWHSFESATGPLASLAGHHIDKSSNGRNGSACARIYATSIYGIVANGTMTTGRMNAGNMIAASTANHAYIDMSKNDRDGNGDPFYVALNNRPDSLVLWMQFHQGEANAAHPYATISAIITDGTRYQDPEDKTYTNVVASAKNNKIAVTGNEWKRISIPFVYTANKVEPRAILVTISTNADPGQGSGDDEVLVDDLTLVYNSQLASLSVNGFQPDLYEYTVDNPIDIDNIIGVADSQGAYLLKTVSEEDTEGKVIIDVFSADLRSHSTYTVNYQKTADGICSPLTRHSAVDTYYNINGQRVDNPQKGQIVIVRQADGKIMKTQW